MMIVITHNWNSYHVQKKSMIGVNHFMSLPFATPKFAWGIMGLILTMPVLGKDFMLSLIAFKQKTVISFLYLIFPFIQQVYNYFKIFQFI